MKQPFQFYTDYTTQIKKFSALLFLEQSLLVEIVMFSTDIILGTLHETETA